MKFLKSIDWALVFLKSLLVITISTILIIIFLIWNDYRWKTLSDGRIYRLNHTCLSSHIETYPVLQSSIDPNGNVYTYTTVQSSEVCDNEIVDTIWKK